MSEELQQQPEQTNPLEAPDEKDSEAPSDILSKVEEVPQEPLPVIEELKELEQPVQPKVSELPQQEQQFESQEQVESQPQLSEAKPSEAQPSETIEKQPSQVQLEEKSLSVAKISDGQKTSVAKLSSKKSSVAKISEKKLSSVGKMSEKQQQESQDDGGATVAPVIYEEEEQQQQQKPLSYDQEEVQYRQRYPEYDQEEMADVVDPEDQEFSYNQEDGYSQNLYQIGDSIARRVEQEKLAKIYFDSHNMKQELAIIEGRCDICTLKPPCKHIKTPRIIEEEPKEDSIMQDAKTPQDQSFQNRVFTNNQQEMFLNTQSESSPRTRVMNTSRHSQHKIKMNEINGQVTLRGLEVSKRSAEEVSPYSILRKSPVQDVQDSIASMQSLALKTNPGVGRTTRSEILKQLALKQKLASNPTLFRKNKKVDKEDADKMAMDPLINDMSYRVRNRRGEYQSIDFSNRGASMTAGDLTDRQYSVLTAHNDINKAENRLRVIEQISKFREEKIKKEFLKLEEELRIEEEKNHQKMLQEIRSKEYFRQQKERLFEYQKVKQMRQQAQDQQRKEEMDMDIMKDHQRKVRNEANKIRLEMYQEMKAQEIMEQAAMLPKKIKRRHFRKFMNQSADFNTIDVFRNNNMNWTQKPNDQQIDSLPSQKSPRGSPLGNKQRLLKVHEQNLATDRKVRQSLNLKIQSSDLEHTMKPIKYKGGKVMYRSIEKPLKLYCHGMRIVDITNPNNQKEIRNQYVMNYNNEMQKQYQSLLGQDVQDLVPKPPKAKKKVSPITKLPKTLKQFQPLNMESQTMSEMIKGGVSPYQNHKNEEQILKNEVILSGESPQLQGQVKDDDLVKY